MVSTVTVTDNPKPRVFVSQCYTTEWRENELSGHSWPEYTPVDRWEVSEPWSASRRPWFNSLKAAEEYAEFAEEYNRKYPYEPPRTKRELAYLASLRSRGLE